MTTDECPTDKKDATLLKNTELTAKNGDPRGCLPGSKVRGGTGGSGAQISMHESTGEHKSIDDDERYPEDER